MVVVGLDDKEIAFVFCKKLIYFAACLIVHHIHFDLATFAFQQLKSFSIPFKDGVVLQVRNWQGQDGIYLIVVHNEKTHITCK